MNGQIYNICCITAAAKKALREKSELTYNQLHENKIWFQFLPEKKILRTKNYIAGNVPAWYDYCLKKGLQDLMLFAPVLVKDRSLLGYSNTSQSSIICFYEKGKVTYFSAQWGFDSIQKIWNVVYTEYKWKDAPLEKPHFENNIESFKSALSEINNLAIKIDCDEFAVKFQKAFDILEWGADYSNAEYYMPIIKIPEENQKLFVAASIADVFGAMGSWNDSPPYMAKEKGLENEYDVLSSELLKQIRLATLYAINGW